MAKSKPVAIKMDEEWKVESDMRCLMEAAAIRKDKKRMAKVKAMAQKKLSEVAGLAGDDMDD
jgi:hypothetical protein